MSRGHRDLCVCQPNPRPAVRSELNHIRREGLTGMALVDALSKVYHLYGLETTQPRKETGGGKNDELPRIMCSEALV